MTLSPARFRFAVISVTVIRTTQVFSNPAHLSTGYSPYPFRDKAEPLHPLVSLRDDGGAAKGDKTLVERGYSPLRGRDAQEDVRLSADPAVLSEQVQFAADLRPVEIKNRLSVSYLKAEGDRNDIRYSSP